MDITRQQPHDAFCSPRTRPINVYEYALGFATVKGPGKIALEITQSALDAGLDPFRVRTKRVGDHIIVY